MLALRASWHRGTGHSCLRGHLSLLLFPLPSTRWVARLSKHARADRQQTHAVLSPLTATLISCCMSKCKASFDPPCPPGATSTAAMTAETYAVTAALQDRKQDGQEITEVGPHSALYTAVTINNLPQKDPLNQQFTPGIVPPSAAPSPGLAGE